MGVIMKNKINYTGCGGEEKTGKYKEVELWSGTQASLGSIQLSESVRNFDQILILWNANANSDSYAKYSYLIATSDINYTKTYQYQLICTLVNSNYSSYASLHFSDATHLTIDEYWNGSNSNLRILKVLGIKWEAMISPIIYSEQEREVGVWTDGKPLYQKTIVYTPSGTVTSDITLPTITNAERMMVLTAFAYKSADNRGYFIPHRDGSPLMCMLNYNNDVPVLAIRNDSWDSTWTFYITLQYTKATDTPGSGIWTTTGEYAHHYSTTEHVIGTWVDGSTLYEKTIVINNPASGGDWVEYDIGVPNLNKVIKQEGTWDRDVGSSGIWTYDLNAVNELSWNNNYIVNARIRNGTKKLAVYVGSQYSCPQLRFTFQYTKTT